MKFEHHIVRSCSCYRHVPAASNGWFTGSSTGCWSAAARPRSREARRCVTTGCSTRTSLGATTVGRRRRPIGCRRRMRRPRFRNRRRCCRTTADCTSTTAVAAAAAHNTRPRCPATAADSAVCAAGRWTASDIRSPPRWLG